MSENIVVPGWKTKKPMRKAMTPEEVLAMDRAKRQEELKNLAAVYRASANVKEFAERLGLSETSAYQKITPYIAHPRLRNPDGTLVIGPKGTPLRDKTKRVGTAELFSRQITVNGESKKVYGFASGTRERIAGMSALDFAELYDDCMDEFSVQSSANEGE
jgi:hypothetical protein